jgi:hypothetical protein
VARLGLIPRKTLAALSGRDGQILAQIATARVLAAPALAGSVRQGAGTGTSGNARSLATVVAETAATGPSLALIGALGGIVVAAAWTRSLRRRRSSDQPI